MTETPDQQIVQTQPEPRIKVVHLVRSLEVGGLESVVLDLAAHRSVDYFDVKVVCLEQRGELAERFEDAGVQVLALDMAATSLAHRIWIVSLMLRRLKPDVLHTHNCGPHVNGALAARVARVPVLVHTKHGRNYVDNRKKLFQNRIASRLSSKVVCVSNDAATVARQLERVPANLLEVVHNGIDFSRFCVNRAPLAERESIRAIHVARLNQVKDQATLLRAVRRVVDALPGFHLDIVGDGPAREEVMRWCVDLQLGDHVSFRGMRDDVPEWLARADLFVLSSVSEGISLTLLEAMAAGLPVVATDVGGNREVVEDGRSGKLVPPRDPDALAEAILQICRHAEASRIMGQRGRQRVEREFSVQSMVARYEELYCELLERRKPLRHDPRPAGGPESNALEVAAPIDMSQSAAQ